MDFLSLAKQRCSVRSYKDISVSEDRLSKLLDAAHVAPTAANYQSERLLIIKSKDGLEKLKNGVDFHGAPLTIIVCGNHTDVFVRPYDKKDMVEVDATIIADHIIMEAEDLGLSSCWLTYFDPTVIRKEFNIPNNLEPVAIIAIGYAAGEKASPNRHSNPSIRKPINSVVTYETF